MQLLVAVSVLSLVAHQVASVPQELIYFGHDAVDGAQPWMVSFQTSEGRHLCGGSLITPNAVLTAAHCVVRHRPGTTFQVGLGLYKLDEYATHPGAQIIKVKEIIKHSDYDKNGKEENDLAIVKLAQDAKLSATVKLADLSRTQEPALKGKSFTVTGWGETRTVHPYANTLQAGQFEYADRSVCREKLTGFLVENYHVCVQGKAGTGGNKVDTCVGDSGGPLILDGAQVGVLSQGFVHCHEGYPALYVNVAPFLPWIQQHASEIHIR